MPLIAVGTAACGPTPFAESFSIGAKSISNPFGVADEGSVEDYLQKRGALAAFSATARWVSNFTDAYLILAVVVHQRGPTMLSVILQLSTFPILRKRGLEGAVSSRSLG